MHLDCEQIIPIGQRGRLADRLPTRCQGEVAMKRLRAPMILVITLLLLVSVLAAPAQARQVDGSVTGTALDHPIPQPGGDDGSDIPVVLEGDPDELTGGNLSITDPGDSRKPGAESRPNLWQSFLNWIQQSAQKFQTPR